MKGINNPMSLIILAVMYFSIHNPGYSQSKSVHDTPALPRVITFDPDTTAYQEIFDGANDSLVFYSGVVTIIPDKSGDLHNTEIYEEMIVVLEGEGQVRITKQKDIDLEFGNIAYIPPHTEHQVFNTGTKNLKYIYIAAKSDR